MATAPTLDAAQVQELLPRILGSRGFVLSERMGRLLRYLVEQTLEGRSDQLKEYLLGVDVFDRGVSFDPRIDPIVRVEMRRLRAKLAAFYEAEGRGDAVRLEIPTGTYVPRLVSRDRAGAAPAKAVAPTDIVVLPFTNLSAEPDTDYFSDGLTEELIHALARAEGLRVVAWSTASRLKERRDDLASIARELKVGTILQGSVRRSGDRLRILVNLVEAATGFYLWCENYDFQMADLFAIQEKISQAIAGSLRARLLGKAPAPPSSGASTLSAYDLYLRGRFHWHKRTPDSFERAIAYFQEALTHQPDFAPAFTGLSDAYTLLADHGLMSPADAMPKARAAAQRALEINPRLAEAYASLALIEALYEREWKRAGEHFRRAIELQPGYATAHHWYGCDYLSYLGRFDEAVASMQQAIQLDPLSPALQESFGYVLMLARRYDEALAVQLEVLDRDRHYYKSYTAMGRLYLLQGMSDRAIEMLERGRFLAGDLPTILGALTQAYAHRGDQSEARSYLNRLIALAGKRYVPSTSMAIAYLGVGEKEKALDWLEGACERRELTLPAVSVHPVYDELRGHERFKALIKTLGLPFVPIP